MGEEELLPPPPKKQATPVAQTGDEELLPPPPPKKKEVTTQGLQQPAKPSTQNGVKLGEAQYQWSQQKPTTELAGQVDVVPQENYIANKVKAVTEKSLKKADLEKQAYKNYNIVESNSKFPQLNQLNFLYKQLEEAKQGRGMAPVEEVQAMIDGLKNSPVELVEEVGQPKVAPILKKSPYKTVGELEAATNTAKQELNRYATEAKAISDEIAPDIKIMREQAGFKPNKKDEQGNEYYEQNPWESYFNGLAGSLDAMGIGVLNLIGDSDAAKDAMKKKWVKDNVLYPKQSDDLLAKGTETLGGLTPLVAGGAAGGTPLGTIAVNALLFGGQDYGNKLYQSFAEQKMEGKTDEEALKAAESNANFAGVKGLVLGATMPAQGALGRKIFLNPAEKGAFKTFLAEQGVMAPAFGASTALQNIYEGKPVGEGVPESVADAVIIGGMFHALHAIPKLPAATKTIFEKTIGKNFEPLANVINKGVQDGVIDYATAERVQTYAKAYNAMPKDLPAEVENTAVDKVVKIQELEKQKEETDEAFHGKIDAELEAERRVVAEETGAPLTEKEQKDYEKLLEKRDATDGEGKKKKLLDSEKKTIAHYEKRIEKAETIGKEQANKTAEELGFKNATHLLNKVKKEGLGEFEKVQDIPQDVLEKVKRTEEVKEPEKPTEEVEQTPEQEAQETPAEEAMETTEQQIAEAEQGSEMPITQEATTNKGAEGEVVSEDTGVQQTETGETAEPPTDGVKKTLVTKRAYEGEFRDEVKSELEKIGLTREVESQAEVEAKAKQFIEQVGIDAAVDAVRSGDVKGANAAAILAEKIEALDRQMSGEQNPDIAAKLYEEQAQAIEDLGNLNLEAGRLNSFMNRIYQTSDLGYKSNVQRAEWVKKFGEEPSPEMLEAWKERDKQIADLNARIEVLEKAKADAEANEAVSNIKEATERKKKTYTKKAKEVADKVRKLKMKPFTFKDENGNDITLTKQSLVDWNELVELAAVAIEKTGEVADGVSAIMDKVSESDWYKKLSNSDKARFAQQVADQLGVTDATTEGKIKIPKSLIRELVAGGIDNINDLTVAVKERMSEEYPNATDREIRDAITNYGRTVNPNKEQVETDIRKMKRIGRSLSALEDIANKKRPLKSGAQRDKLDAEERALLKEVREAMKDLPIDEAMQEEQLKSALDAAKTRVNNQIEDLQREIDTKELVPRNARTIKEDAELKTLKEKRDKLKGEHDKIFKDDDYKEQKRLELTKKAVERRVEDLQRRLREGDFSVKKRKPVVPDDELTKLKAEKLRIQEEYDKEFYKNQLANQTKLEKAKDAVAEAWGLTRVLSATGDLSFVGIQGWMNLLAHPMKSARAFMEAVKFMGSEKYAEDWLRRLRASEYYPLMKESKLSITEPKAELSAREELFYSGWTNMIWDSIGSPFKLKSEGAYEKWQSLNPFKALERGAVGYLDTVRVQRFMDGLQMLEMQGKNIYDNKQEFKDVADMVNTFTGRASLGKLEQNSELLTKVFFSPRNWTSILKTSILSPAYFASLTPTARKMAIADFSKAVGLTTGMVAMVAAALNNDDDKNTNVELDPRSSDFMKIRLGDKRIDPWGGRIQQVVFLSRMLAGARKSASGEVYPLGTYKGGTRTDLITDMAFNKLAPSASLVEKFFSSKLKKDGEGYVRTDKYGNPYDATEEIEQRLYPIYWQTIKDLQKDGIDVSDGLLAFYALMGGGVNVYESKAKKEKEGKPKRPEMPTRPKRPNP